MKLKISFKIVDDGNEKEVSRTFSNLKDDLSNENLKNFAQAFMSLTNINSYKVEKITSDTL